MSSLFDLTGRTALITGSVRGIGYALAEGGRGYSYVGAFLEIIEQTCVFVR